MSSERNNAGTEHGCSAARQACHLHSILGTDDEQTETNNGLSHRYAVSRWHSTAAARARVRPRHVGFVVDKVALVQVLS
jgi:hypothetical protein